jgi:hypothetical protein
MKWPFAAGLAAAFLALWLSPSPALTEGTGPFAGMSGAWTGSGVVSMQSGANERIRCRASYNAEQSGTKLQLELRCASDSYKFEFKSNVNSEGGAISGIWSETLRNAAGTVLGRARGGHIEVKVESPSFTANMAVNTRGDKQQVTIRPQGAEVTNVSIQLSRS